MLYKLQSFFSNSIISTHKPDDYFGHYHWFSHESEEWIGIPKQDLNEEQLLLLKTLFEHYHHVDRTVHTSPLAQSWYSFLFENGSLPHTDEIHRLIYFQWTSGKINHGDFEAALNAFFENEIIIVWENDQKGILIEPKTNQHLTEQDFIAMYETIKTDFYIDPYFFIGKFRTLSNEFLALFYNERALFDFGRMTFKQEKVFYFEILLPKYLALHLPDVLHRVLLNDILPIFKEDHELYTTIKAFLKNNMNASITAKKLFIHRNTLQYRLDKFAEKTSIPLKDFNSALTVFIACLLFESFE